MRLHSQIVPVGSAELRVQQGGDARGETILLLHGGLGTCEDFAALLPFLADYRCVLIDSRGHGASTLGTEDLLYSTLAADAAAVLDTLKIDRPYVIGHSDGGIAGIHLATSRPLAGLVTLGAQARPPASEALDTIFRPLTAEMWRGKFPDDVALYERLNPAPDFDRLFAAVHDMWFDDSSGNYPGEAARAAACPALVIGGDQDQLVTRAMTFELAELMPRARLAILPYASHVPHLEMPAETAALVRAFLTASPEPDEA